MTENMSQYIPGTLGGPGSDGDKGGRFVRLKTEMQERTPGTGHGRSYRCVECGGDVNLGGPGSEGDKAMREAAETNDRVALKAFLDEGKKNIPVQQAKYDPKSRYYDHGGIEVLDIIKAKLTPEQYQGFCLGNAIKYTCRANHKGDYDRDLEKAEFYTREAR